MRVQRAAAQLQCSPLELHGLDVETKRRADGADIFVVQLPDYGGFARIV
jgi:hypothetical protein